MQSIGTHQERLEFVQHVHDWPKLEWCIREFARFADALTHPKFVRGTI